MTENKLFDGSIITPTENYYIEPASRYSDELIKNGIHSVVYKSSDVYMLPHNIQITSHEPISRHYCASQQLHEKIIKNKRTQSDKPFTLELNNSNNKLNAENSDSSINEITNEHLSRNRRWLADEVNFTTKFISIVFSLILK